jgi:hypothetical protein
MQLVDMEADPFEANPIPAKGKEVAELKKLLMKHIQEAGKVPWQKPN